MTSADEDEGVRLTLLKVLHPGGEVRAKERKLEMFSMQEATSASGNLDHFYSLMAN